MSSHFVTVIVLAISLHTKFMHLYRNPHALQGSIRRTQRFAVSLGILMLMFTTGCQSSPFSKGFAQTFGFRESTSARENPAGQMSDPWIQDVGKYTKGEHTQQEINDPLKLRNFFMSDKAQDIERNLGIGG